MAALDDGYVLTPREGRGFEIHDAASGRERFQLPDVSSPRVESSRDRLYVTGDQTRVYDARNGRELPVGRPMRHVTSLPGRRIVAAGALPREAGELAVFTASYDRIWGVGFDFVPPLERPWDTYDRYVVSDDLIVTVSGDGRRAEVHELIARSAADGVERWRLSPRFRAQGSPPPADMRAAPCATCRRFVATSGRAVVSDWDHFHVIDTVAGRLVHTRSVAPAVIEDLDLDGRTLYAVQRTPQGRVVIVAYDVDTGAEQWRSRSVLRGDARAWGTVIAVSSGRVLSCMPDGVLRAHDARTGREVNAYGVGDCWSARHIRSIDAIVADDPAGVVVLERSTRAPPARAVWIRGRVSTMTGARVREVELGDRVARVDARGHFSARIRARGAVRVSCVTEEGLAWSQIVELDSRSTYSLSIHVADAD